MNTKDHYEKHLSAFYSWIYGGTEENYNKNRSFFEDHKIIPSDSKAAVDLGAGPGFQSIPLARAGFKVTAVDFSKQLLNEITEVEKGIEIIEDDILNFAAYAGRNPELILCMGDTLTHLPDKNAVTALINNAHKELTRKGKLVLTFRDLTFELEGPDRFIPVRQNDNQIFTCFLEYQPDYVDVYDMVHRKENGGWTQKISSYKKLKISEETIKTILQDEGFTVDFFNKERGLITIIAGKK